LYKLLSERDLELRHLRKKAEQEKVAGTAGVTSEAAATKIVELSKKVRELTAECESEKSKGKQWARKCMELEHEVSFPCCPTNNGDAMDGHAVLNI